MPKRPETPPPGGDEPRYLTVVHPYPLNATFELPGDQHDFVRWLACCTGKDVLLAFFHKPSSPGMAIIEVDRDFDGFDRLLGAHKWSKVLQNPSEEQLERVSKVYYCTLNTGRKVEKNGWNRINIKEHWFHGWQPQNKYITYPYPETSYCKIPSEDKTNLPLCRPLPVKLFPPPPPAHLPPVGSSQWLDAKSNETLSTRKKAQVAPKATGAWAKGAPKNASKRAGFSVPHPSELPTPAPSIHSATPSVVSVATSNNPWSRGLPLSRSISPRMPALSKSSSGDTINTLSPPLPTPNGVFPTPPGLEDRQHKFSWSEDVERSETETKSVQIYIVPDGYGYKGDGVNRVSRIARSVGSAGDDKNWPRSIADAMADLSFGTPPSAKSWSGVLEDDIPWPAAAVLSPNGPATDEVKAMEGEDGAGWAGYADPKEDPIPSSRIPSGVLCPDHGLCCNKGICGWRSTQKKKEKYAKQDEEQKKKKARVPEAAEANWDGLTLSQARALRAWKARDDHNDSSSSGSESSGTSNTMGGGDDAQSVASTARKAWSSVASSEADSGPEDGQDDVQSVASARTNTTDSQWSEWATTRTPRDPPQQQKQVRRKRGGAVGQAPPGMTPREIQRKTTPPPKDAWGVQSTAGSIESGPANESGWEDAD